MTDSPLPCNHPPGDRWGPEGWLQAPWAAQKGPDLSSCWDPQEPSPFRGKTLATYFLQRPPLNSLPQINSLSQQIKSVLPSIAKSLSSRTVLKEADHTLSFSMRHMCACALSLGQDPFFGLLGIQWRVTCSGLCGLFLALHCIPQGLGTQENCQVHIYLDWIQKSSANPISTATMRWNKQSSKRLPKVKMRPEIRKGLGAERGIRLLCYRPLGTSPSYPSQEGNEAWV